MSRRYVFSALVLASLVAAAAAVLIRFRADMKNARAALAAYDTTRVETSFGAVELVDQGFGFPVLSIHGTGGGFDQGVVIAEPLRAAGYRIIAPSRFGYPGSSAPDVADAAAQADAFAEMLDHLGIERAVVTGASAGAVTALQFAERHPERTAALLLMVPAYYPGGQAAPATWSPMKIWAITRALQSDFLFWAGLRLFPTGFASALLATDRTLIRGAGSAERARLDGFIAMILPISARARGLMLDMRNTASPRPADLSAISVPTFVASAEDDRFRTADCARLLARGIVGAELLITPDGGHVWVNRSDEVSAAASDFLDRTLGPA